MESRLTDLYLYTTFHFEFFFLSAYCNVFVNPNERNMPRRLHGCRTTMLISNNKTFQGQRFASLWAVLSYEN